MFRRTSVVDRALSLKHPYGPLRHLYDHDVVPRLPARRKHRVLRDLASRLGPRWQATRQRLDEEIEQHQIQQVKQLGWGRQLVFDIHWLAEKVHQGGIADYLSSTMGGRIGDTLQALHELRVDRLHQALLKTCDQIFHGPAPSHRRLRQEAVARQIEAQQVEAQQPGTSSNKGKRRSKSPLDRATRIFYDEEIHLVEAVREWISQHPDEFGQACSSRTSARE